MSRSAFHQRSKQLLTQFNLKAPRPSKRALQRIGALALSLTLSGCCHVGPMSGNSGNNDTSPLQTSPSSMEMDASRMLHEQVITLDSHLDTPAQLVQPGFDIMQRHDPVRDFSQVDLPRMIEGGLDGGFWVIYSQQGPLTPNAYAASRDTALLRALAIHRMVAAHPEHFELATRAEDAARITDAGRRVVFISMENAYPLGEDLSLLQTFHNLGVRMVGPVHFRNNQFADSSTDLDGQNWRGLSPSGRELVREANRLGIILDASHAHDEAFDEMIALSATPLILSHSGAKAVYDHPRNLDDERLKTLAEHGGVIQMNAYGSYLKALRQAPQRRQAYIALREEMGAPENMTADTYAIWLQRRRDIEAAFPGDMADFEDYMDHFLHVLELIGPEHVGIGADWDGGGGVIGMQDIAAFPMVTERLLDAGYSEAEVSAIWSGNLLRVLKAAEDYSASLKEPHQK